MASQRNEWNVHVAVRRTHFDWFPTYDSHGNRPNDAVAVERYSSYQERYLSDKDVNKFGVLINFISPSIFQYVEECTTYEYAIEVLQNIYVKPRNEIYARYILATRRQQSNETLDEYLQALKSLSKDCNFKSVTAVKYCEEGVRDAFITGLQSNQIRQRLLENKTLDLKTMFDQARALESAMRTSESYMAPQPSFNAAVPPTPPDPVQLDHNTLAAAQHEEHKHVSSVVTPSILVLNAQLVMPPVTNVKKKGTLRKHAVESQANPKRDFQLQSGPQHSPPQGPQNPSRSHQLR
ncbi:hypothetical protein QZH41_015076 [Actinostola sp. cb2023]|nr:hypothetical protein QZH41_015076 [Actinostola sp. cb2023]